MNRPVLYIPPTMRTFSLVSIRKIAVASLLFWSFGFTQNHEESMTSDLLGGFGKLNSQLTQQSGSESDFTPYVSDAAVNDSLYQIGPGDIFLITIESASIEKQVNPEGNIVLGHVGIIHLEGLTLREANQRILDQLQKSYKQNSCFVNLARFKTMRVFVTGAINAPGVYQVPGNYRLSDALKAAKDFSVLAQKGNIKIIAKNGDTLEVNPGNFLMNGDINSNPYLTQGCVIQVPFTDYKKPWVTVKTDSSSIVVQMSGTDETALGLVLKSYSYSLPRSYTAFVVREKAGKDSLLTPTEAANYKPQSGAYIEILSSNQEVFVGGAVLKPGYQIYRSNHKILQYISEAGLLVSSKIPKKIDVIRKNGERETVPIENVLNPGDMIYVDQNGEQRFLLYTPVLLSFVSLTLALLSLKGL